MEGVTTPRQRQMATSLSRRPMSFERRSREHCFGSSEWEILGDTSYGRKVGCQSLDGRIPSSGLRAGWAKKGTRSVV
jgi:hypothetical protein